MAFCMCGVTSRLVRLYNKVFSKYTYSTKIAEESIKKSVFISQSTDIFRNLALEDWLYKNYDFSKHHILMIWCNRPCVVIGRHQNAWLEANIPYLNSQGIPLVRRNSGGGTVYHDEGNINFTFFSTKENYNRQYNLQIISRALFREYNVIAEINNRDDIMINHNYKISGTAAKLGRPSAYHHCTLLVNSNKANLSRALFKQESGISTKATSSIRSAIKNLSEENSHITVDGLQSVIGWEYLRTPALHIDDGRMELISQQNGFQYVNPIEDYFPGINDIHEDLCSWEWRFGKTPPFKVSRSFTVPSKLLTFKKKENSLIYNEDEIKKLRIDMTVENGLIMDVTLNIPPGLISSEFGEDVPVITHIKDKKFTSEALVSIQMALQALHLDGNDVERPGERERFITNCFDKVVNTI